MGGDEGVRGVVLEHAIFLLLVTTATSARVRICVCMLCMHVHIQTHPRQAHALCRHCVSGSLPLCRQLACSGGCGAKTVLVSHLYTSPLPGAPEAVGSGIPEVMAYLNGCMISKV